MFALFLAATASLSERTNYKSTQRFLYFEQVFFRTTNREAYTGTAKEKPLDVVETLFVQLALEVRQEEQRRKQDIQERTIRYEEERKRMQEEEWDLQMQGINTNRYDPDAWGGSSC